MSWLRFLLLSLTVLALPQSPATALTLGDLVPGGGFASGDLIFDDFQGVVAGALSSDLSSYAVLPSGNGFGLGGPLTVTAGSGGTLSLSYRVTSLDPAQEISLAFLGFAPLVLGGGSFALVSATVEGVGLGAQGSLIVYDVVAGAVVADSLALAAGLTELRITQLIQLDASTGLLATTGAISSSFAVVPEPLTLLLMGWGLLGLALLGRARPERIRSR
jgi:hypothetical protein